MAMHSTNPAIWDEIFEILSFASVASFELREKVHDENSASWYKNQEF